MDMTVDDGSSQESVFNVQERHKMAALYGRSGEKKKRKS
jgi:hypothetical protein